MGINAVLLAYKEGENLVVLLPQIKKELCECGEEFEIIVVDTMEPLDNTEEVCRANGARYINQEEPHFAGAFRTAIKYASMEKFLILDADGSHNPKYIPDILSIFNQGADVAIGSRYVKGGKTEDSKISQIMSRMLNRIYRLFLGIRAKDISTNYRIYHTAALKRVTLKCHNYDVQQEVLLKLRMNKPDLVIAETPIVFTKRMFGESKRRLISFILGYLGTLIRLTAIRIKGVKDN